MTQPSGPHPDRLADVDMATAASMVQRGQAVLLDVREPEEWAAGHAPDSVHVPLAQVDGTSVPRDLPIVAICRSGNRSGKAADTLAAAGHQVHNVTGGMRAWAAEGHPVRTDDGTPGTVA